MKYRIFISSVQREFAKERRAIADYIRRDALFGKFFDVFIFEETPAANVPAQKVYLEDAANCDVYLGLIGAKYGNEDDKGVSPTEREYDAAARASRHILVFLKGGNLVSREDKEAAFLRKVESERVRRSFRTIRDLRETLAVSLVRFLEEQGKIQSVPFDMSVAGDARIHDLSVKKMRDFVRTAREVRGFRLPVNVPANVPANGTMDGTINGTLALSIVSVLEESPSTTLDQLAKRLNVARRSLVRYMNILQNNNRIRRVGGKRFGHWEVLTSQSE